MPSVAGNGVTHLKGNRTGTHKASVMSVVDEVQLESDSGLPDLQVFSQVFYWIEITIRFYWIFPARTIATSDLSCKAGYRNMLFF